MRAGLVRSRSRSRSPGGSGEHDGGLAEREGGGLLLAVVGSRMGGEDAEGEGVGLHGGYGLGV